MGDSVSAVPPAVEIQAPAGPADPSEAPAPPGFLRFCIDFPEECGAPQGKAGYQRLFDRPVLAPYWESVFSKPSASLRPRGAFFRRASARSLMNREEEATLKAEAAATALNDSELKAIVRINRDVNWRIEPRTDLQAFGASDYWTLPLSDHGRGVGDCEDFVLQKRSDLRKAGFSMGMMSVAIVGTPAGQTHAILLLNTNRGVLVLDNLDARVRPLSRTAYRIISRERLGDPMHWKAGLSGGPPA